MRARVASALAASGGTMEKDGSEAARAGAEPGRDPTPGPERLGSHSGETSTEMDLRYASCCSMVALTKAGAVVAAVVGNGGGDKDEDDGAELPVFDVDIA